MAVPNDGITLTVNQPTAGGVTVATWSVTGRTDIKRWEISRDGIDADAIGPLSSALLDAATTSFEFNLQPETAYSFSLVGFTLAGETDPVTASYTTGTGGGQGPGDPPTEPGHGSTPHAGNLADPSVPDSSLAGWGTLGGATDDGTFQAVTDHDHANGALKATADGTGDLWIYAPNVDVTAGATMTFGVDVFTTRSGLTGHLNLEYYTSTGGWVDESNAADIALVANQWTRLHATVTPPSGTGNVHPNPTIVGVAAGDVVLFTLADYFVGADDTGDGGGGNPPPGNDGTQRAVLGGWGNVTWGDEFNYTGTLDSAKWSMYDGEGHDGNGVRSPAAFSVNGDYARCHGDPGGTTGGCAYQGYSSVYHRVEVRARMAADGSGSGEQYHPVLIMWPDSDAWPQGGEYDFAESDIGDAQMGAFMHHPAGTVIQDEYNSAPLDLTQWHNYAFECSPTGLRAWIDGQPFFTDTNSGAYPPPGPMHLTWQLDNFGGTSHKGANLDVMWVRGYNAPS